MSPTSVVEEGYETDETFTTIGSLESYSSHWTKWSDDDDEEPEPSKLPSEEDKRMQPLLRLFSFQERSPPKTFDSGRLNNNPSPSPPLLIPTMTSPADLPHTRSSAPPYRNPTMGSTP
ncbi:hypothetical protein PQX77_017992 [Marasmius sp. AFHP31]|nr:hypothetical protein PQX77_017992 [Marasmius sp. AFHP31]